MRPFWPPLDIVVSRSAAIIHLTQFFFNLPRPSRYAPYLPTYLRVCVRIHTSANLWNHFAHEQFRRPVQFLRHVFAAFFLTRFHLAACPKRIRSSARKGFPGIHANFNLFGYASRPLPGWWGKSAFDDDDGEINETIDLHVTFKSRLLRHRSSLDLLGYSLARSFN